MRLSGLEFSKCPRPRVLLDFSESTALRCPCAGFSFSEPQSKSLKGTARGRLVFRYLIVVNYFVFIDVLLDDLERGGNRLRLFNDDLRGDDPLSGGVPLEGCFEADLEED